MTNIYHENGRFFFNQFSFCIPSGMCLSSEQDSLCGIQMLAPDESFFLDLVFVETDLTAEEFIHDDIDEYHVVRFIGPVSTVEGVPGSHAAYETKHEIYDEFAFDVCERIVFNVSLRKWKENCVDENFYNRVKNEILDSLQNPTIGG